MVEILRKNISSQNETGTSVAMKTSPPYNAEPEWTRMWKWNIFDIIHTNSRTLLLPLLLPPCAMHSTMFEWFFFVTLISFVHSINLGTNDVLLVFHFGGRCYCKNELGAATYSVNGQDIQEAQRAVHSFEINFYGIHWMSDIVVWRILLGCTWTNESNEFTDLGSPWFVAIN